MRPVATAEEMRVTAMVLSGDTSSFLDFKKQIDYVKGSNGTVSNTANSIDNSQHLRHLKMIHQEMKKSKVNLIYTFDNHDSDCPRFSLVQVAIKTIKV